MITGTHLRGDLTGVRRELERELRERVENAIREHRGNLTRAGRELAVPPRTFHRWITVWGLRPLVERERRRAERAA